MKIAPDELPEQRKVRLDMRKTQSGKLLLRCGFDPFDTESSARRVAEKAAREISKLIREVRHLRNILSRPSISL
jgi:hypothetical protein